MRRNFVYPTQTAGSRLARQVRRKANKLSAAKRRQYLKEGMKIVNKG